MKDYNVTIPDCDKENRAKQILMVKELQSQFEKTFKSEDEKEYYLISKHWLNSFFGYF